jgi:hypothetical protein
MNDGNIAQTLQVSEARECRYVRLVNVGKNHRGDDMLTISVFELFGTLVE